MLQFLSITIAFLCATSAASATCLEDAAAFANRICGEVSNKGRSQLTTSSGQINAEARGLLRQVLGTAGGEIKADTKISTYENVLQEQLAGELVDVRKCGAAMAVAAMNQVCTKPVELHKCRHPDFGQEGWARSETLEGTRGWGGGYNQDAYCSDYISGIVNGRQLGGKAYKTDILRKSEEGRWRGIRRREYNYHCTIQIYWEPIYNERTDERCNR